jgi:PAS domain S-box-containing protein
MASKVAEGNLEPNTEMALVSNDEIGDLWASFQTMTQGLKETTVSKSYLDNILESMADTLIVVNSDGKIRTANRAALELLGCELSELFGHRFDEVASKYREETSKGSIVDDLIREDSIINADMFYKTKAGDLIPVSFSSSVMGDINGSIQGIVCVATDITERKLAEQEKEKLQLQLQQAQKMEAIGTLAGGVAHDLNNILSGIVTYPDLLLMQTSEDSPLRKPLLTIQETGKKAAAIVQDMLTLARRGVAITEVVSLNDVIFEYLNSPEYKKMKLFYPDVEMETNLEPGLLNILGSPIHISKTIMNLVSNAAEAIGKYGKISITTENRYVDKPVRGYDNVKDGDYAMIIVSDTGEGISAQDMEKIFEPFYTKKRMGKSGTGLGMPVVWGTVKDHNGYIDLQSTQGKGTTFTLYFPITRKEPAKHETHIQIEDYMGSGESILVVDDVKEQREIALTILSELGYSVNTVPSGEEAVKYMQNTSIDLLILDMIMDPGMDGLDTYKEILKLHPGQRAIIASGFAETDRAKEVIRLGAGQYIKKPYTLEKMGMAVRKELNKS